MDPLRIRLLGQLEVEGLTQREVGSRKGRTLLTVLAVSRGRTVPAEQLADLLWPDRLPANPAEQVQVLVSRLRTALGADRIERAGAGYVLRHDWLDLDELDLRADEAAARTAAGAIASARAAAAAALHLVRGRPLADEEGEWADAERRRIETVVASTRLVAAEAALAGGNVLDATRLAEASLAADPFDEPALRVLMLAHVAAGKPAAALAAYARTREVLADELGTSPTDATEALHADVLLGRVQVPLRAGSTGETTLFGRDRELAQLDAELAAASTGPARLVAVVGEPGIGKSALLAAFTRSAADRGVAVVAVRGDPAGADLPLQPLFDALDLTSPPPSTGTGTGATVVGDHDARRGRLHLDLLERFQRLAADGRMVMTVDDAHDVDRATLAWLQFAVKRSTSLLVVVAARPPLPGHVAPTTTIELGPIDRTAAASIVGAERAAAEYDRSGGNPLYLIELARSPAGAVPEVVLDNARGRADALGPAALTLRTAAVLGGDVDIDLVAACLSRSVAQVLDDLEAAVAAHLLVESGTGFAFSHDLVRDALTQTVTSARRAYIHREATRSLERRRSGRPGRTAFHARRGGATATAAAALIDGAAIAAGRFDLEVAERLLDESIQLLDQPSARVARARIRMARSDHAGAAADLAGQLGSGAPESGTARPGADAAVHELAGWVAYYQRDFTAARRMADEALRLAPSEEVRSSALALAGRIRHSRGELDEAESQLRRAAADHHLAASSMALVWLGALQVHLGRFGDAVSTLAQIDTTTPPAHPFAMGHAWIGRCMAHGLAGDLASAFAAVAELDRVVAAQGPQGSRFRAVALNLRGWLRRSTGDDAGADACNTEALTAPVGAAFDEPRAHARLDLAEGRLRAGEPAAALAWVDETERGIDDSSTMVWHIRQRVLWLRARAVLAMGDAATAATLARQLEHDARRRGSLRYAALSRHLATVAAPAGTPDATLDALVDDLGAHAALDAWWLTLDLADATGGTRLVDRARAGADQLIGEAGRCSPLDVDPEAMAAWVERRFRDRPLGQ